MTKKALIVLADGFEDIEAVAPIDILNRAGVEVVIAGLENRPIKAAYGITLVPQTSIDQVNELFDCVIFPGGRKNAESLAASEKVIQTARNHCDSGKLVAAICAAPSHVLAEAAGLLKGKRATGDPGFNDRLSAAGAIVTNEQVTVDGNIITGRGPGAAMLFALMLTEKLAGKEIADQFASKWTVSR